RFGPTADQMAAVAAWLKSQGFVVISTDLRMRRVRFSGTVATIGQALQTSIVTDGRSYANTSDPIIPAELARTIQAILGLTSLPKLSNPDSGSSSFKENAQRSLSNFISDEIVNGQGPNFAPSDLYTFYNETTVLNGGNLGTGAPDCMA